MTMIETLSICFLRFNANIPEGLATSYLTFVPDLTRDDDLDIRVSSLICARDDTEVFAVELDGSITGSVQEAIEVLCQIPNLRENETFVQTTLGLLRAIKKLQQEAK